MTIVCIPSAPTDDGAGGQTLAVSSKVLVAKNNLLRLLDPRGRLADAMLFKPLPEDRYPAPDNFYDRWRVWGDY